MLSRARAALTESPDLTMGALAASIGISRASLYTLFGDRDRLILEAGLPAPQPAGDRLLHAAAEILAEGGLLRLSVDEAAQRAGVSRAFAFRSFPGKDVLFRELLRTYVPMREVLAVLATMPTAPPDVVMPQLARSLLGTGSLGIGVLRAVLFELSAETDLDAAGGESVAAYGEITAYLEHQMAAGRLVAMHPYLAMQLFVGPILVHLLNQEAVARQLGVTVDQEEAAATFAGAWLRAMQPSPSRLAARRSESR